MSAKTKEIIGRWLLVLAANASLVIALTLIFNPKAAMRTYLVEQGMLGATIGLFGVLSASFIAAIALLYVYKQTQTYSWRRDQALKDIGTIYEPLYKDVAEVAKATGILDGFHSQTVSWNSISNSYLGTKLELVEPELYRRLRELFSNLEEYGTRRWNAIRMVEAIAKKVIEPYLNENLQAEIAQKILNDMPVSLDYERYIYRGFLIGKSVREWSSLNFRRDEEYLIKWSRKYIEGKVYWQHQQFTFEQIEAILNEIYQKVQDDVEISQIVNWCNALNSRAAQLKKELEDHILKPQLP